jgi:2-polyprenyl-3-methyl-5-hydroxy-6-metoxy-1,4-benzoquinol methylase
MVIVEPGDDFYNNAVNYKKKDKNIECYHALIEDVIEDLKEISFDFIIISSLLHELKNNLEILKKITHLCHKETIVHINVPNKKSLHRILAYRSGIIPSLDERSDTQIRLQQNEFFDLRELNEFIEKAGLTSKEEGTYFVKPFTHDQMSNLLENGVIDRVILDGFYGLATDFPENGSEIYVNAQIS